jgi:hypothetical protein
MQLQNHRVVVLQTESSETQNNEAVQTLTQSLKASG